jgi:hypothetical protein
MSNTADQARELANLFSQMADTVDAYRSQHFTELSLQDRVRLEGEIQQLEDIHDRFESVAIEDTLKGIQSDLNQITTVTSQAKDSLNRLTAVEQIISLVSAAAELGADITSGDYGAIPQSIKELIEAIAGNSDNPSDGNIKEDSESKK